MKISSIIVASIFGVLFSFNYSQALTDPSYVIDVIDRKTISSPVRELSFPDKNLEILILFALIPIILAFIIHYLNISKKIKIILFFLSITILFFIIFISFNPTEISYLISKNKTTIVRENSTYNKQEANSSCNQENKDKESDRICELSKIFEQVLSKHYFSSLFLDNKYYIQFDNAKSYTFWLYAETKPSVEQADFIVTAMARKLDNMVADYDFNFEMIPKNSEKIPGDTKLDDSYFSQTFSSYHLGSIIQ